MRRMLSRVLRRAARSLRRALVIVGSFLVIASVYITAFYMRSAYSNQKGNGVASRELLYQDHRSLMKDGGGGKQGVGLPYQACLHQKLELWPPALNGFFKVIEPLGCSQEEENWVYTANGSVHISPSTTKKHGKILCQYLPVTRGKDDFEVLYEDPIKPVVDGMPMVSDFFDMRCVGQRGGIYANLHSGIRRDSELQRRQREKTAGENPLGLNVLIVGFDSVSTMTWRRNLPKSHRYLTETLGGIVLEGYNIVGDGTPQALLPLLTGKTEEELPEARRGHANASTVDGHPWIWKELKKLGYITQWGEDGASAGTFTYRMLGFKEQPVDHYLRPFYIKAESRYSSGRPYCLGSIPRHLNMFNWIREFFQMYPDKPKFSFLFHSEYTHDLYNELQWADDDLRDFLHFMESGGHLDDTLLILMADHGARFHALRQTVQGKYEERMPYFSLRLPPKFQREHPDIMRNLKINSQRLTTPFDVYATFRDVINFTGGGLGDITHRGISLFKEIPKERTCTDAAVQPHWCTCLNWVTISPSDQLVRRAATSLVNAINAITQDHRADCLQLDLLDVLWALRLVPNEKVLKFKQTVDNDGRTADFSDDTKITEVLYQITVTVSPSMARYEATVKYLPSGDVFRANVAEISRINKYATQPHCVMDRLPHLRPYCYCQVQLGSQS